MTRSPLHRLSVAPLVLSAVVASWLALWPISGLAGDQTPPAWRVDRIGDSVRGLVPETTDQTPLVASKAGGSSERVLAPGAAAGTELVVAVGEPVPPSADVVLAVRTVAADAPAGLVLVDDRGQWRSARLERDALVLDRSREGRRETAASTAAVEQWLELSVLRVPGGRQLEARSWPVDGVRPDRPTVMLDPIPDDGSGGRLWPAVWGVAGARLADMRVELHFGDGRAAAGSPLESTLEVTGNGVVLRQRPAGEPREVEFEALDAADARPVAVVAPPKSSFPCDPYRYHYAGIVSGDPAAAASLRLPPIDNDCDGLFNEDPWNLYDDDGDGAVDEDQSLGCDEALVSWDSSDSRYGTITTGDSRDFLIVIVRFCWPVRTYISFAPLPHALLDYPVAGVVRVQPEGGGEAWSGSSWPPVHWLLSPASTEPLSLEIVESGAPLADGTILDRPAVIDAVTSGGAGVITVVATIDGQPYELGTAFAVEGEHQVEVVASDGAGASAAVARTFVVDLLPPVFDAVEPGAGSLQDATPISVAGQVSADAESVVVAGVAATLAPAAGDWRGFSAAGIDLVEGANQLHLVATDRAGRTAELLLNLDLDTTPPALVIDSPVSGTVFPSSPVVVTGEVQEAHLDSLSVNGVAATLTGSRFTATVELVEGANTVVAVAVDDIELSAAANVEVVLDSTAPDVAVTAPSDGTVTNQSTVHVEGTVEDPYLLDVTVNGVAATVNGVVWSAEVELAEGANTIAATAADTVGNTATTPAIVVVRDTTPPVVTVVPPASPLDAATVTVTGTAADPHLASVVVNGVAAVLAGDQWTASGVSLQEGPNSIVAVTADAVGNSASSEPVEVVRDSLPPSISITEPTAGAMLDNAVVAVSGTVEDPHLDAAAVTVNGVSAVVADGSFSLELTLAEGDVQLVAAAADTLGHSAVSDPVEVTVDTLAPVVSLDEPVHPVTGDATAAVTGSIHEPHPGSLTVAGLAATVNGSTFSVDGIPLTEGPNTLTAVATDTFGHSAQSNTIELVLDTTPPALTVTEPTAGFLTAVGEVTVRGTVADPYLTGVTVNGIQATVAGGAFELAGLTLAEGVTTLVVRAEDVVDNVTEVSVVVVRDTAAPVITLDQPATAPGVCLAAGEPQLLAGTVRDVGQGGAAPGVDLTVRSADGTTTSVVTVVDQAAGTWTAGPVALGSVDGNASAVVVATDAVGNQGRAVASWRLDGTPPAVALQLDGGAFPGAVPGASPAPGVEPTVLARAATIRALASDGGSPVPSVELVLDGAGYLPGTMVDAEGDHVIVATATDCAGHVAAVNASFRIDLTPPALVSSSPAEGAHLAEAPAGFSATATEPLASATLAGAAATVDGAALSVPELPWREGANTVLVELVDLAGHRSTLERHFEVRTQAPQLTLLVDGAPLLEGALFLRAIAPEVRCTDAEATVSATLDGAPFASGSTIGTTGDHVLAVTASDAFGHTAELTRTFRVDLSDPPVVTIGSPADGTVLEQPLVDVSGTATGSDLTVTVNGLAADLTGDSWSLSSLTLEPDEPNLITAVVSDGAGRTASASVGVLVRTGAPQVLILEPAAGAVTSRSRTDVVGVVLGGPEATADGTVDVAGQAVVLDREGGFRALDVALVEGSNTVTVMAVDDRGRSGSATVDITSDATAPSLEVLADGTPVADGASLAVPTVLTVTATDVVTGVVSAELRVNGDVVPFADGSATVTLDEAGGYLLTAAARDVAGNEASLERTYTAGAASCAVSELEPGDGAVTADATVTLRGMVRDAVTVAVDVSQPGSDPPVYDRFPAAVADGTFVAGDVPLPLVGDNILRVVCIGHDAAETPVDLTVRRLSPDDRPWIEITSPPDDGIVGARQVDVAGTVSDSSATVTVGSTPVEVIPQADGSGVFSLTGRALAEGPNSILARAVDGVGRVGEARVVVYADTRAPQLEITSPADGDRLGAAADGSATVTVRGVVDLGSEPHLGSVVATGPTGSATATVDPDTGVFEATVTLDAGVDPGVTQVVTVSATDTAPAPHEGSASVDVYFDPTGPWLRLTVPEELSVLDETAPAAVPVAGDAWAAEGAAITVNGATLDPLQLAWEAADPATGLRHVAFETAVTRPAADGVFAVVARVTQLDGRRADDRRLLRLDTTAPEVVRFVPADGATGLSIGALPMVLFNEAVQRSSLEAPDGLALVRLATADPVVGNVVVDGAAAAFVPGAALAAGESYRLRAGTGITDLAGHQLAAPREMTFTVAGAGAVPAVELDPLDPVVCTDRLELTGVTVPGTQVEARDGELRFTATAGADGRFELSVVLAEPGFHLLRVAAVDRFGTTGAETTVVVRLDCGGPTVEQGAFDRMLGVITLTMSEAIEAGSATVGAAGTAIRLSDADDPTQADQTAAVAVDDRILTLTLDPAADAWWRDSPVRLVVGPPLADTAGNQMAASRELVFAAGGEPVEDGAFLFGEVWDDAGGRPLSGARVRLYPSGTVLPGTVTAGGADAAVAEDVTDQRGRYSFGGGRPAGAYVLVVEREDRARGMRRVLLEPGAPVEVFDLRLPMVGEADGVLDPVAGGTVAGTGGSGLSVVFDPAAAPGFDPVEVRLVPRSDQALPDLLPLGWTPVATAELVLGPPEAPLPDGPATPLEAGGVRLRLPLPGWVEPTDELVAVRFSLAGGGWRRIADPRRISAGDAELAEIELPGPGTVALLLADDHEPPPMPDIGGALVGAAPPATFPELVATLTLDPAVVSPGGRATARVLARSADDVTAWPSGLAVQSLLQETLHLADGGRLDEAPFRADLVLYRPRLSGSELGSTLAEAAGVVEFHVSPSERASAVLLEVGWEELELYPFPERLVRETVVGAGGGAVTTPDGTELELPDGALSGDAVVDVARLSTDELAALPPVLGFDTLAGIRISLEGSDLARAATLRLTAPAGTPVTIPGDPRLVLAQLVEDPADGRGAYPGLVARVQRQPSATGEADRLVAAPEPTDSGLMLPGIAREGTYLLLAAQQPIAFATGIVRTSAEIPLQAARVTVDGLGLAGVSRLSGRYATTVLAGLEGTLRAAHPTLDETGSAAVPSPAPGTIVNLDITVLPVPPTVVSVSPSDHAVDQPVGTTVSILFSEPLDPATVSGATLRLELADAAGAGTGAFVRGSAELDDDRVHVVLDPELPLPPGRRFLAHFAGGVRDASGTAYDGDPLDWSFTTSTVVAPGGQIHPELIHLTAPENGIARISAEPGALPTVPSGSPPWAVRPYLADTVASLPTQRTCQATASGGIDPDWCYFGDPPDQPVTISNEVWVQVIDPYLNIAAEFRLGPFTSADGLGVVAPPDETVEYTTAEGVTVSIPAGAFDAATMVRVSLLDPESLGVTVPDGLGLGAFVDVDFEGIARESVVVRIPAPPDIDPAAQVFFGSPVDLPWGRRLRFLDVGGVVEVDGTPYLVNDPGYLERSLGAKRAGPGAKSGEDCVYGDALVHLHQGVDVAAYYELAPHLNWMIVWGQAIADITDVLFNSLEDVFVYLPTPCSWNGSYVLPAPADQPLEIVRRDSATGWVLDRTDYDPVADPGGGLAGLGRLPQDLPQPQLIGGSPFDLVRFSPPADGDTARVRFELEVAASDSGVLSLHVPEEFEVPEHSSVMVYRLPTSEGTEPSEPEYLLSGRFVEGTSREWTLGPRGEDADGELVLLTGPGDLDPLTFGSFQLQFDRNLDQALEDLPAAEVAILQDQGVWDAATVASEPIDLVVDVEGGRLTLTPSSALPDGHRFVLRLAEDLRFADETTYHGPVQLMFSTRDLRGDRLGAMADSEAVPSDVVDMVQLGNLAVVAARGGDLFAVDLTSAAAGGVPGDYVRHATYGYTFYEKRGLAVDHHGRVYVLERTAGGYQIRTVRQEDIREPGPDGLFWPVEGRVLVSYPYGLPGPGLSEYLGFGSLPAAKPNDLELLVTDDSEDPEELSGFFERYGATNELPAPDDDGVVTFQVELDARPQPRSDACDGEEPIDAYQRVSVDNLTSGQVWSFDIGTGGDAGNGLLQVTLKARAGDELRVRRNIATVGYVALIGGGVGVVDLNRFYRTPLTVDRPGREQCGRYLGIYQGLDLDLLSCPGLQRSSALQNAVAVAPIGATGEGDSVRGAGNLSVAVARMHAGTAHASSPAESPGSLTGDRLNCMRQVAGSSVVMRDLAIAPDVEWVDYGIHAADLGGSFADPPEPSDGESRTGDLLFVTLGDPGVFVFDVSRRKPSAANLVGRLAVEGHGAYRAQVDAERGLLFVGSAAPTGWVVDVWDLAAVNSAPGTSRPPQPVATLEGPPFVNTGHLGLDTSGTGLFYTWNPSGGVSSVPFERPRILFSGLYVPESYEASDEPDAPPPPFVQRFAERFVPLGVPMELSESEERDHRLDNDRQETAAFRLRLALPGAFGPTVRVRLQSLRVRPDERYLGDDDLGPAAALPGGPGWPDHEVEITLRRLGGDGAGEDGRFGTTWNQYESRDIVLLLADPRAAEDYTRQDLGDDHFGDEESQCRRCERPAYLPETLDATVVELLAAGPYLRASLVLDGNPDLEQFFHQHDVNYPRPVGVVDVVAWADAVPSPLQVAGYEPVLNPATWSPGEGGAAVSLASGDMLLGAADLEVPGRSLGFGLERSYRSGALGYGPLGAAGWSSRWFAHLRHVPTTGEVEYHDGRGHVWRFFERGSEPAGDGSFSATAGGYDPVDASGGYLGPRGLYVTLQRLGQSGWRLTGRHNDAAVFDANGRLIELRDRHRKGAEDPDEQGSTVFLEYDAVGRLHSVEDDYGRHYRFEYCEPADPVAAWCDAETAGLLARVVDFDQRTVDYAWDELRRLTTVQLPEVTTVAGGDYGTPYAGADRPELTYVYRSGADLPDEAPHHGAFSANLLEGYRVPGTDGSDPLRVRVRYDAASGRVDDVTFPGGDGGQATWELEIPQAPADPSGGGQPEHVIATVLAPWSTAQPVVYDIESGRVHSITRQALVNGFRQTVGVVMPMVDTFSYEADGRVAESIAPDDTTRSLEYPSEDVDLRSRANITVIESQEPPPSGGGDPPDPIRTLVEEYLDNYPKGVLDPNLRFIEIPVGEARDAVIEKFGGDVVSPDVGSLSLLDEFGQPTVLELGVLSLGKDSAGSAGPKLGLAYGADARGREGAGPLSSVSLTELGEQISFDYDARFNVDQVVDTIGTTTSLKYDEWDRPVETVVAVAQTGVVDPVGSGPCAGITGAARHGMFTQRAYDAAGHVVRVRRCQDYWDETEGAIAARWIETELAYNAREQVTDVWQTHLPLPGVAGEVESQRQQILHIDYDAAGRVVAETAQTAVGPPLVKTYSYDDLSGRVTAIRVAGRGLQRIGYDIAGRVNFRTDGDQGQWFGQYDGHGRLVQEILPTGAVVDRQYDAAGNVTSERTTTAGGELLAWTAHHRTSFGALDMGVDYLVEDPQSPQQIRLTRRYFDASGRTVAVAAGPPEDTPDGHPFTLELDAAAARRVEETAYEPFGTRVTDRFSGGWMADVDGWQLREHYEYDSIEGDEEPLPWPSRIERWEAVPDADAPALTSWTELRHDTRGRPTWTESSDGSSLITSYDRLGGAIRTETGAGTITTHVYDGWGHVLRTIHPRRSDAGADDSGGASGHGATAFAYGLDGRLLSRHVQELTGDGTWLDRWVTTYDYSGLDGGDGAGDELVDSVTYPDGTTEAFRYASDGVLAWTETRDGLELTLGLDAANRVTDIVPAVPDGASLVDSMVPLDGGDHYVLDALSRTLVAEPGPGYQSPLPVTRSGYDLGGRPLDEAVGDGQPLVWDWDVFDSPVGLTLPTGLGRDPSDPFTGFEREFDSLGRVVAASGVGLPGLGATWRWGGLDRLYSMSVDGPSGLTVQRSYYGQPGLDPPLNGPDPGATWRLAALRFGSGDDGALDHLWGGFELGWRGTATDPQDGAKIGRRVLDGDNGITAGMGWSWQLDNALRLVGAAAGRGSLDPAGDNQGAFEVFGFEYGASDQLERMTRSSAGTATEFEIGASGRIDGFEYDPSGRRIADDHLSYMWDWRGRLMVVDVPADGVGSFAGHQVRYDYDATGRLAVRVHYGPADAGGDRGLLSVRKYLWDGDSLVVEGDYGSTDGTLDSLFLRWRRTYLPGPTGLDDAVQVRVQTYPPLEPSDRTYSFLRDELGTVVGLVEETAEADPTAPDLVVRYLYTPYGEAHAEVGPELRRVLFDNDRTTVETPAGTVTQVPADAEHVPGALVLELSRPVTASSAATGIVLVDHATGTTLVPDIDYAIGFDPARPEVLHLLALSGWYRRSAGAPIGDPTGHYSVRLTASLTDAAGHHLVHEHEVEIHVPAEGAVAASATADLVLRYDSVQAASATLDARFPGGQNLLFQGLWTDPTTGLSYARNRWYDARTASWLSEDPLGPVDSPNLYAFVGWGPHVGTDPMGFGTDYNLPPASPAKPKPTAPGEQLVTWCEKDPVRCAQTREDVWAWVKSNVWADEIRDAGSTFFDERAPASEKLIASGIILLAGADIVANFVTGGTEGAVEKGAIKGGTALAERATREAVERGTRELVDVGISLADDAIDVTADVVRVIDDTHPGVPRPTWRESEAYIESNLPDGYRTQRSYIEGEEVPYSTRGSVRPDASSADDLLHIEVKNYELTDPSSRARLYNTAGEQIKNRRLNLPEGSQQLIIVDARGQDVAADVLERIPVNIATASGNVVSPADVIVLH